MRMVRECLRGAVMAFRLHNRIQHDVVLGVRDPARGDGFGLSGRLSERDHLGVLAHPANPLGFHLLFRGFFGSRIGLGPIRQDVDGSKIKDQEFLHR